MTTFCLLLFILLVALQFSDAVLTWRVIAAGGSERNPLVARLMRAIGMWPALLLTKCTLALLVYRFMASSPAWLLAIVVLYLAVVVHNWQQMTRGGTA